MNQKAIDALKATRGADSQQKRQAVQRALADAVSEGGKVTLSSIAQHAGVSRQFLYSHADLKAAVEVAARSPKEAPSRDVTRSDVEQGLRADHRTLIAKVERQRATIADLRTRLDDLEQQRRRWLGSQLEATVVINPEDHAELRAACDRLLDQNAALTRRVAELERVNAMLDADLAASRQAHAEDLAVYGMTDGHTVVSLHSGQGSTTGRR